MDIEKTNTGKNAIVTGANSGIGLATAKLLCEKGYTVFIVGRNTQAVEKAAKELNCRYIIADLSDTSNLANIYEPFQDTGLDILVNNAGIGELIPIEDIQLRNIQEHFTINTYSPLLLIQGLLPALTLRKGSITNISSVVTTRNTAGFCVYAASKSALESITKCLAIELAPQQIRVNAICPGAIDTPMLAKSKVPNDLISDLKEQIMATIPLRRRGLPKEIAQAAYSQIKNTYVTGAIWHVDGGVGA